MVLSSLFSGGVSEVNNSGSFCISSVVFVVSVKTVPISVSSDTSGISDEESSERPFLVRLYINNPRSENNKRMAIAPILNPIILPAFDLSLGATSFTIISNVIYVSVSITVNVTTWVNVTSPLESVSETVIVSSTVVVIILDEVTMIVSPLEGTFEAEGVDAGVGIGVENAGVLNAVAKTVLNGVLDGVEKAVSNGVINGVSTFVTEAVSNAVENGVINGVVSAVECAVLNGVSCGVECAVLNGVINGVVNSVSNGVLCAVLNGVSNAVTKAVENGVLNGV